MAVTVVVEGAQPGDLAFGLSPLAELGAALHVLHEPGHHPHHRTWVLRTSGAMQPALAAEATRFAVLWSDYRVRFLLPGVTGLDTSLDNELAALARHPLTSFAAFVACAIRGGYSGVRLGEVLSRPDLQALVDAAASRRGPGAVALAAWLWRDPEGLREMLLQFLAACGPAFFDRQWRRTLPALAAEVARKRRTLAGEDGIARALVEVSGATSVLEEPRRIRFDKVHHGFVQLHTTRLVALPSWFTWPHVLVKQELVAPAALQYPLPTPEYASTGVPLDLARKRLRALSDPARLQTCRALAREPVSTTDLARSTGVSTPQISRQLRPLRELGLVTTSRHGHEVRYQLNLDEVLRLGAEVLEALLR